jgi:signal transduction histidine kinase
MAFVAELPIAALNVCLAAAVVALGVRTYRRYDEFGSRYLSLFAVSWAITFLSSTSHVYISLSYGLSTLSEFRDVALPQMAEIQLMTVMATGIISSIAAAFLWLLFVISYTTNLHRRERRILIGTSLGIILLSIVSATVQTLNIFGYISIVGTAQRIMTNGALFVSLLGMLGAAATGFAQLVRTSREYPLLTGWMVVSLSAPLFVPLVLLYTNSYGVITEYTILLSLDTISLSTILVGLWLSVERYQVFETFPAAQTIGRDTALDNLESPVVVLNTDDHVSDLNRAAEQLFEVSFTDTIGEQFEMLLPDGVDSEALLEIGRTSFRFPGADKIIDAQTALAHDDRGRRIGRTIIFHDVTAQRRRRQRIQLFNRVLRHNLRTEVQIVNGYVDVLATENGDDEYTSIINAQLDELVSFGEKAKQIEHVLNAAREREEPMSLAEVLENALVDVDGLDDHEGVTSTLAVPEDVAVTLNVSIITEIVVELVENALEHADPSRVEIAFDREESVLTVSDDGSGLPPNEIEVLEQAEESALQHGSGMGLWMVKWGADRLGGELSFDTSDGTTVAIQLPQAYLHRIDATPQGAPDSSSGEPGPREDVSPASRE